MKAEDVAMFSRRFMNELGAIMKDRIILDADEGKFQNNKKKLKYKSADYKMRKKTGKIPTKSSSADTQTSFVNMRLSGDTLNRMQSVVTNKGFDITYSNGEIVLGNANRGYDLYGLSNKNFAFLANQMEGELQRKIRLYEAADIEINLGKK